MEKQGHPYIQVSHCIMAKMQEEVRNGSLSDDEAQEFSDEQLRRLGKTEAEQGLIEHVIARCNFDACEEIDRFLHRACAVEAEREVREANTATAMARMSVAGVARPNKLHRRYLLTIIVAFVWQNDLMVIQQHAPRAKSSQETVEESQSVRRSRSCRARRTNDSQKRDQLSPELILTLDLDVEAIPPSLSSLMQGPNQGVIPPSELSLRTGLREGMKQHSGNFLIFSHSWPKGKNTVGLLIDEYTNYSMQRRLDEVGALRYRQAPLSE